MQKVRAVTRKHWFLISTSLIVLLAFFLRFYDYDNRWGLAYDQAYGAILARYALEARQLPLLGPFSSAGPFQTGGEWYWFVMLGTLINPSSVISPWIVLSLTSVLFVLLIIFLGKKLVDEHFGLIVGLLSAVSTSQIAQSFSLTNQSIISIIALFAVWSSINYIRERNGKYLFFLGFFTSLAATIHLQGAALIFLVVTTIIFTGIPSVGKIGVLLLGLFIPTIPILIFELKSNFLNTKNMLHYYLYDQYKISFDVLGRRWLTYLGSFWPTAWSHIIGGDKILSWLIFLGIGWVYLFQLLKKKVPAQWNVLLISFLLMVGYLRYLRTPLFDSYLIFLHPFIFLLVGWLIWFLFMKNRLVALLFFLILILGSLYKDIFQIKTSGNYSPVEARKRVEALSSKFPNEKFSVYSYQYNWSDKNLILSLYLANEGKIDDNGRRIGIVAATMEAEFNNFPTISGGKLGYKLIDLNSSTSAQLSKGSWVRVNPKDIYERTQEWYKIK